MSPIAVWISLAPLVLLAMAMAYPEGTIRVIDSAWERLRAAAHRWRTHLVHKYGERAFAEFAAEFRVKARKDGYEEEQIQKILQELRPEVIERLGRKYVNEVFGRTVDY